MKTSLDKAKGHRQHKVAILVNTAIAEILRRGKKLDENLIDCPITITKVIVTGDLKLADCYFVPFNTNLSAEKLIAALNNSKYAIRHLVATKVNLKYFPDIRFHYDYGFDNADQVEQLLKDKGV
ncbi:30S ribosome-binding factor RbfA [Candidatus Tisiphia endosymbiont of Nemotelus uliginosus]|uniref:30S ribosome-binding factor RbfA n=1 Tax=Candidatus Tisiphia endosymbiont of Nemotelus uliginosus TaxID=3077926 RepID=UPI0035C8E4DF